MTLEPLRAVLAALVAIAALAAGGSCARDRAHHDDTTVASRRLGESTASPGSDPNRPVAGSVDTQEVSARLSRTPGAARAPGATTPTTTPTTAPTPPAAPTPPTPTTPPTPQVPTDTSSPGAFSPPPRNP